MLIMVIDVEWMLVWWWCNDELGWGLHRLDSLPNYLPECYSIFTIHIHISRLVVLYCLDFLMLWRLFVCLYFVQ